MLKLSDNPPIRSPRLARIAEAGSTWWVGHTKARSEKAFAWDLNALGIDYFLPLVPKLTISGGRKRTTLTPLFSGYVFFNGDREARLRAFGTDRICNAIEVLNPDRFIRELGAVEQALESNLPIDIYRFAVVGRRVRVIAGSMAGVVGTILDREGITTLIVEVEMLSQKVAIPMHADLVVPLDE